MHIELTDVLQSALATFTSEKHMEILLAAKDSYFHITGKLNEDDEDFELRMNLFHDWYLLDFLPKNRVETLIREYFNIDESSVSGELREALLAPNYSYFEYLGDSSKGLLLMDLLHKKKILLAKDHPQIGMLEGDIFVGRVLSYKKGQFLMSGRCILPREIKGNLKKICKEIRRKKESNQELNFLLTLEKHKTTYTRYGHIDPVKIFTI